MRLFVVGVPNLVGANKKLKSVIDILVIQPLHLQIFNLSHTLLLMRAKLKLVLIAPQNLGLAATTTQLAEHVVEVEHLVSRAVADQHQHGSLMGLVTVLY